MTCRQMRQFLVPEKLSTTLAWRFFVLPTFTASLFFFLFTNQIPISEADPPDNTPFYHMQIESVTGNSTLMTIVTTGAQYELTQSGINMYSRIDPATNLYYSEKNPPEEPRQVATLTFDGAISSLTKDAANCDSRHCIIQSDQATFEFMSDSLFLITAKQPFAYMHQNLIQTYTPPELPPGFPTDFKTAPWNKKGSVDPGFPDPHPDANRIWTDGKGGSLHVYGEGAVTAVPDTGVIDSNSNLLSNATHLDLGLNAMMAHMVFPAKKFDFDKLYGKVDIDGDGVPAEDARPFIYSIFDDASLLQIQEKIENGTLETEGFGTILLYDYYYYRPYVPSANPPQYADEPYFPYPLKPPYIPVEPAWKTRDYVGYEFSNPAKIKEFIRVAHAHHFKVITYFQADSFNPDLTPRSWAPYELINRQPIEDTLQFMRDFKNEYQLDGWFFDSAKIHVWHFLDNYNYIRQVREDLGDEGMIAHHDSVDVVGLWSGFRAVMIDSYINYNWAGETGRSPPSVTASVNDPNDPYLRFYVSGYGLSQTFAFHLRKSNRTLAISESEKARTMAENLNGVEMNDVALQSDFKLFYDRRREEYRSGNFHPDVDWPIDPVNGWFRPPTNIQVTPITGTSFQISWETNADSDSEVAYTSNGAWWPTGYPWAPDGPEGRVGDRTLVRQHRMVLRNLQENKPYKFRIRSKNRAQNVLDEIIWGYVGSFETHAADSDHDSIDDDWEMEYFGTLDRNGLEDFDGDLLNDLEEFQHHTNPASADTDLDGYDDFFEIQSGYDPLDWSSHPPIECNNNGVCENGETHQNCSNDCKEGLLVYYSFNYENAWDQSGNHYNGALYGSPQFVYDPDRQSMVVQLQSDASFPDYLGMGEALTLPQTYGRSNRKSTIAAWVKPTSVNKLNIVTQHLGGFDYFSAGPNSGKLITMVYDATNNVNDWPTSNGTVAANQWSHVVFVLEEGIGWKFYINGNLDKEENNPNLQFRDYAADHNRSGEHQALIGYGWYNAQPTDNHFDGSIDDVSVWNRALSAEQICQLAGKEWQDPQCIDQPRENLPPEGTIQFPGEDLWVASGAQITLSGVGTDPDGNYPLAYRWHFESELSIPDADGENPAIILTNPSDHQISITISLTVTDSAGLSDPTPPSVRIILDTEISPTEPPEGWISRPSGNISVEAGQEIQFRGDGMDRNQHTPLTYHWSFGDPQIPDSENQNPTISYSRAGEYAVALTVTNSDGVVDPTPATLTVTVTRAAPRANAGADQIVIDQNTSGFETVTLDGSASFDPDADGSIVRYEWKENGNLIATGERVNVELSVGIHLIVLTVTDNDNMTGSDEVSVIVKSPPIITSIDDQTVREGESLEFTVEAHDPDGDSVRCLEPDLSSLAGAQFDVTTCKFSWTPRFNDVNPPIASRDHEVTFAVEEQTELGLQASETVRITVQDANVPPVLSEVYDQRIAAGRTLEFRVSAFDVEQESLTFQLIGNPNPMDLGATLTVDPQNPRNASIFRWTPTAEQARLYENLELRVEDPSGNSDSRFFAINVETSDAEEQVTTVAILGPRMSALNPSPPLEFRAMSFSSYGSVLEYHFTVMYPDRTTNDFGWQGTDTLQFAPAQSGRHQISAQARSQSNPSAVSQMASIYLSVTNQTSIKPADRPMQLRLVGRGQLDLSFFSNPENAGRIESYQLQILDKDSWLNGHEAFEKLNISVGHADPEPPFYMQRLEFLPGSTLWELWWLENGDQLKPVIEIKATGDGTRYETYDFKIPDLSGFFPEVSRVWVDEILPESAVIYATVTNPGGFYTLRYRLYQKNGPLIQESTSGEFRMTGLFPNQIYDNYEITVADVTDAEHPIESFRRVPVPSFQTPFDPSGFNGIVVNDGHPIDGGGFFSRGYLTTLKTGTGDLIYTVRTGRYGSLMGRLTSQKRWEIWDGSSWSNHSSLIPDSISHSMAKYNRVILYEDPDHSARLLGLAASFFGFAPTNDFDTHGMPTSIRFDSDQGFKQWNGGTDYQSFMLKSVIDSWNGIGWSNVDFAFDPNAKQGLAVGTIGKSLHRSYASQLTAAWYDHEAEGPAANSWYRWHRGNWIPNEYWPSSNDRFSGGQAAWVLDPNLDHAADHYYNEPLVTHLSGTDQYLVTFRYFILGSSGCGIITSALYDHPNTTGDVPRWFWWNGTAWESGGTYEYDAIAPCSVSYWAEPQQIETASGNVSFFFTENGQIKERVYDHHLATGGPMGGGWQAAQPILPQPVPAPLKIGSIRAAKSETNTLWLFYEVEPGDIYFARKPADGSWSAPTLFYRAPDLQLLNVGMLAGGVPICFIQKPDETEARRVYAISLPDSFWSDETPLILESSPQPLTLLDDVTAPEGSKIRWREALQLDRGTDANTAGISYGQLGVDEDGYIYSPDAGWFKTNVFRPTEDPSVYLGYSWGWMDIWGTAHPGGPAIYERRKKVFIPNLLVSLNGGGHLGASGHIFVFDYSERDIRNNNLTGDGGGIDRFLDPDRFHYYGIQKVAYGLAWPSDVSVDDERGLLIISNSAFNRLELYDVEHTINLTCNESQNHFPRFSSSGYRGYDFLMWLARDSAGRPDSVERERIARIIEELIQPTNGDAPYLGRFFAGSSNEERLYWISTDLAAVLNFVRGLPAFGELSTQILRDSVLGQLSQSFKGYRDRPVRPAGMSPTIGEEGSGIGQFKFPQGSDVGPDGALYVADTANHRIQKLVPTENGYEAVLTMGRRGRGDGELLYPVGLSVDPVHNLIFVADTYNNRIQVFDHLGNFIMKWDGWKKSDGTEVVFAKKRLSVIGIAADRNGNLFFPYDNKLEQFSILDEAPEVFLGSLPNQVAVGTQLQFTAHAEDDWGVTEIKFEANGALVELHPVDYDRTLDFNFSYLFNEIGQVQISVTAKDAKGNTKTASHSIRVYDPTQNQPPQVNAGADQTITLPNSATLDGTVTDDELPTPHHVTTLWSKVSGPGTVTFGDPAAIDTTAQFSEPGTYHLKLTASDGDLEGFAEVAVVVNPAPPEEFTLTTTALHGHIEVTPTGGRYQSGATVSLQAVPETGYQFDHWEGALSGNTNPTTLTMNSSKTVTAVFILTGTKTFSLTVEIDGNGSVTQSPSPNSSTIFTEGTVVALTATPSSGNHFVNWTGDATGTPTQVQVTMSGNKTVTAHFAEDSGTPREEDENPEGNNNGSGSPLIYGNGWPIVVSDSPLPSSPSGITTEPPSGFDSETPGTSGNAPGAFIATPSESALSLAPIEGASYPWTGGGKSLRFKESRKERVKSSIPSTPKQESIKKIKYQEDQPILYFKTLFSFGPFHILESVANYSRYGELPVGKWEIKGLPPLSFYIPKRGLVFHLDLPWQKETLVQKKLYVLVKATATDQFSVIKQYAEIPEFSRRLTIKS